ncbi:MAG: DUF371 domain-containing protein [Ignisphaera sp.]
MAMRNIVVYDRVEARGHESIRALHTKTFELTKDIDLTPRGDCIIGVGLDKAVAELDPNLINVIRKDHSVVVLVLEVGELRDVVLARGSQKLVLGDKRRIVVRKSRFIGPETLAIEANKAARDIDRRIIQRLQNPSSRLVVHIYAIDMEPYMSTGYVPSIRTTLNNLVGI